MFPRTRSLTAVDSSIVETADEEADLREAITTLSELTSLRVANAAVDSARDLLAIPGLREVALEGVHFNSFVVPVQSILVLTLHAVHRYESICAKLHKFADLRVLVLRRLAFEELDLTTLRHLVYLDADLRNALSYPPRCRMFASVICVARRSGNTHSLVFKTPSSLRIVAICQHLQFTP